MPLDTQTFGITRHWLSVGLEEVAGNPEIFGKRLLGVARKAFLAGSKQLPAIKNWLWRAGIIDIKRGSAELTDLGRLCAARDRAASRAWTWWLIHLHLCANPDSSPYSTFFCFYDVDGGLWLRFDDVIENLGGLMASAGQAVEPATVETYFAGVHQAFRPGWPLHDLLLVEQRVIGGERERPRLRRASASPADVVVAYATLLFQQSFFSNQTTLDARVLLDRGLARSLGMKDQGYRDALARIHQSLALGQFVEYRHAVNLDSIHFRKMGEPALKQIRAYGYESGEAQWP